MHPYMPIALALAMLIGFAAHRASLCTVRAVAEMMSSGTAWMLASFLKAAAWVAAIDLLNLMQTAEREMRVPLYAAMDAEIAAGDAAVAELGKASLAPALRADIERIIDLRKRYADLLQATVELIEIEGNFAARRHFEGRTQKVLNTLLFESKAMETNLHQNMQTELEQLRVAAWDARRMVIMLAIGAQGGRGRRTHRRRPVGTTRRGRRHVATQARRYQSSACIGPAGSSGTSRRRAIIKVPRCNFRKGSCAGCRYI